MASTDSVLKLMEKAAVFGLEQAADQLLAEVHSFIPIFTSKLRDSHKIERAGKDVKIRNSQSYARYQYFRRLFHPTRGGKLTRMTEIGGSTQYATAYRRARASGKLTRFSAAWFSPRIVNDPAILRRVSLRFTKVFSSRLR